MYASIHTKSRKIGLCEAVRGRLTIDSGATRQGVEFGLYILLKTVLTVNFLKVTLI